MNLKVVYFIIYLFFVCDMASILLSLNILRYVLLEKEYPKVSKSTRTLTKATLWKKFFLKLLNMFERFHSKNIFSIHYSTRFKEEKKFSRLFKNSKNVVLWRRIFRRLHKLFRIKSVKLFLVIIFFNKGKSRMIYMQYTLKKTY